MTLDLPSDYDVAFICLIFHLNPFSLTPFHLCLSPAPPSAETYLTLGKVWS